eukprot:1543694-Pleurochrysis_carterae.AAC.2
MMVVEASCDRRAPQLCKALSTTPAVLFQVRTSYLHRADDSVDQQDGEDDSGLHPSIRLAFKPCQAVGERRDNKQDLHQLVLKLREEETPERPPPQQPRASAAASLPLQSNERSRPHLSRPPLQSAHPAGERRLVVQLTCGAAARDPYCRASEGAIWEQCQKYAMEPAIEHRTPHVPAIWAS